MGTIPAADTERRIQVHTRTQNSSIGLLQVEVASLELVVEGLPPELASVLSHFCDDDGGCLLCGDAWIAAAVYDRHSFYDCHSFCDC